MRSVIYRGVRSTGKATLTGTEFQESRSSIDLVFVGKGLDALELSRNILHIQENLFMYVLEMISRCDEDSIYAYGGEQLAEFLQLIYVGFFVNSAVYNRKIAALLAFSDHVYRALPDTGLIADEIVGFLHAV